VEHNDLVTGFEHRKPGFGCVHGNPEIPRQVGKVLEVRQDGGCNFLSNFSRLPWQRNLQPTFGFPAGKRQQLCILSVQFAFS
jgi:hypothetical protein